MARFFASSPSSEPADNQGASAVSNKALARWGRRPRLRRQCAHDFDNAEVAEKPHTALSRESGSGCTEAPSSRGASETLSARSPSESGLMDLLVDVSDDEFPWLEDSLRSTLSSEQDEADAGSRSKQLPPLELRVEDFECGECIGKGSYSRVFLGTHIVTGTEWALKVVSKRRTFETKENLAHLKEEKKIAEKVQGSDFLVRTAGTFQNRRSIVFAMEHLPGGDLYQRLADKGTLPLGEAVAWVAQALLAIEDLHDRNIVHRDIKPENFLMGRSGTLKLTDFGFARELAPGERLVSQFGTPEYVAPEVLNGLGHGMEVDLWALGVLTYELLVGRTPFKAGSVDEMYERIAAGDYAFPVPPPRKCPSRRKQSRRSWSSSSRPSSSSSNGRGARCEDREHEATWAGEDECPGYQDAAAQALVKSLLQLNPSRRPTIEDIKRHPFFQGVDFVALREAVREQAQAEEEEAIVNAAIDGGEVWRRNAPVTCISEPCDDLYGGVFDGF